MALVEGHEKNAFAGYCVRSKSDEKAEDEDLASFEEMAERIDRTYKDVKDPIATNAFFRLIDNDGDGIISYEDLVSLKADLGIESILDERVFELLVDRLNHETGKIGKP
jgi:Ca2+-binding EF-hand superfamily protein